PLNDYGGSLSFVVETTVQCLEIKYKCDGEQHQWREDILAAKGLGRWHSNTSRGQQGCAGRNGFWIG
ncbi:hypothetical protein KI387_037431, partial [Taxus chinensis]